MCPLLRIGGETYSWYAIFMIAGYVAGILWLRAQVKNLETTPRIFWSLIVSVVGPALLGGKLGIFVVEWREYAADPSTIWQNLGSGWVFWTGLLAGMGAGLVYQRWYNATHKPRLYLPVADYCIAALAIGHVLGRIGCFLEGCCHGAPTSLPWGIAFTSPASSVDEKLLGVALHPTQLYEAGFEAVAAILLIGWLLPAIRAGKYRYGTAFIGYVAYYSTMRFFVEFLRADDRGTLLGLPALLSPSQWISLVTGAVAVAAFRWRGIRETNPKKRTIYA